MHVYLRPLRQCKQELYPDAESCSNISHMERKLKPCCESARLSPTGSSTWAEVLSCPLTLIQDHLSSLQLLTLTVRRANIKLNSNLKANVSTLKRKVVFSTKSTWSTCSESSQHWAISEGSSASGRFQTRLRPYSSDILKGLPF